MIKWISAALCKRWLRARNIKLASGPAILRSESSLLLEEGASVSHAVMGFASLSIGAMSFVRSGSELANVSQIGRFCSIGNDVLLGQDRAAHPLDWVSSHPFQHAGPGLAYRSEIDGTVVGHDVWIGRGALVFEGVSVGTGSVIAARSVVTKDVPPYAIVAGVPAKVIRYRHSAETIEGLLQSRWWEYPIQALLATSLDAPDAFLTQVPQLKRLGRASYRQVLVTRNGWKELPLVKGEGVGRK